MYELFTLGGGTYLVDLLNAVAAITGGGAFIDLAQFAGIGGLAWVLFRTAFGGSWKDNAKWMLLFVAVWGAMIVPKATVQGGGPARSGAGPGGGGERPHRAGAVRVDHQPGRRRSDAPHRTGLRASQRSRLPPPRADLRGAGWPDKATRLEVTDAVFARNIRNYARQCVFPALLLGHVSADDLREIDRYLATRHRDGHALGRGLAGAHGRVRPPGRRASGTGATTVDRTIVTCRDAAGRLNALWNGGDRSAPAPCSGRRIFPDARTEALARAELLAVPARGA